MEGNLDKHMAVDIAVLTKCKRSLSKMFAYCSTYSDVHIC